MGWQFVAFAWDLVLVAVAMSVTVTVSAAVPTTIHWHSVNGHGVNRSRSVDWVATVSATVSAAVPTISAAISAVGTTVAASSAAVAKVVIPVAERDRKAAA